MGFGGEVAVGDIVRCYNVPGRTFEVVSKEPAYPYDAQQTIRIGHGSCVLEAEDGDLVVVADEDWVKS